MRFYVVEHGKVVERFMCDNRDCRHYKTRGEGMPIGEGNPWLLRVDMEEFDACSPECRRRAIKQLQDRITDDWMILDKSLKMPEH